MTDPTATQPLKHSRLDQIQAFLNNLVLRIIGMICFGVGLYFLFLEVKTPPTHTSHILTFIGFAIFGLALAFTQPVFAVAKGLVDLASPFLSRFKGGAS